MNCLSCAVPLPAEARFCPACGTRAGTGQAPAVVEPPRARAAAWTGSAAKTGPGGRLAALSPVRSEVRKTVTVLFCDLVGSTALSQRLDPEPLRALMFQYFALMRHCLERHGGFVEKYIGDAVMAVFGVPAVHEDDPLRAVRAAADMQAALAGLSAETVRELGVTLSIRIGVNTGPVVAAAAPTEAESMVSGETVNLAARLEQHALAGQVLLGPLTCQAVRGAAEYEFAEPLTLKGIAQPVTPGRLVTVAQPAPRRFDGMLVDRQDELAGLRAAFSQAVDGRGCRLLTLHGDPGIGKSRLTSEFAAWASAAGALVAEGRCPGYGAGGSALALAEAVTQLLAKGHVAERPGPAGAELNEAFAILRRGLLADGSPGLIPDETIWALCQVIAATGRPVVFILDDMQWSDPLLLAVITGLVRRLDAVPALMLCLGRPEFLADHEGWTDDLPEAEFALVGPLPDADCFRLVAGLAELADVEAHDAALAESAVRRSEGNPLYLEQFISVSSAETALGLLPAEAGSPIPVSINALIAYRLDLLAPLEREVLGLAAVCGRRFTVAEIAAAADPAVTPWAERAAATDDSASAGLASDVIADLTAGPASALTADSDSAPDPACNPRAALTAILGALIGRRLIKRAAPPATGYRFDSALVHEVAYGSLPKRWRAATHERLAGWLIGPQGAAADAVPLPTGPLAAVPLSAVPLPAVPLPAGPLPAGPLPTVPLPAVPATPGGIDSEAAGSHWESAWQLWRELGLPATGGRHLARHGSAALAAAGIRSLANGDPKHAADLLDRALVLGRDSVAQGSVAQGSLDQGSAAPGAANNTPPANATENENATDNENVTENEDVNGNANANEPWLLLRTGEAKLLLGEIDAGRQLMLDARAAARAAGARLISAHADLQLAYLKPSGQFTGSLAAARKALPLFEEAGDRLGIARALAMIGVVEQSRGKHVRAVTALERALAQARELDAEIEHATVLGALAVSLWLGPKQAPAAIATCRSLLAADAVGRRLVRAALLCPLAMLAGMTGDHEQAAALLGDAETVVAGLDNARAAIVLPIFTAAARMLAGDLTTAEALLVHAHARSLEIRDTQLADSAQRDLSRIRLLLGADDSAAELADAPVPDDVPAAVADRCGILARVAARRGASEQARHLADCALQAARRTDSPACKAGALLDAAWAMRDLGDEPAATSLAGRAARSFTRKGHRVGAGWAQDLLTGRQQ